MTQSVAEFTIYMATNTNYSTPVHLFLLIGLPIGANTQPAKADVYETLYPDLLCIASWDGSPMTNNCAKD